MTPTHSNFTMQPITSVQNPLIKQFSALSNKQERERQGLILVETQHPIEEALKAGLQITTCFVLEDKLLPEAIATLPHEAPCYQVSPAVMKKLSTTDSIPPCIGIFQHPVCTLDILLSDRGIQHQTESPKTAPLLVVLHGIQDPGNAGTLIRSAAAFGATGVLLTGHGVDAYSPKVIRASAGLVFTLPVLHTEEPLQALAHTLDKWLHAQQNYLSWQWLFTTGHTTIANQAVLPYREVNYTQPTVLLLGNEGSGLPESLLNSSATIQPIRIPMAAGVESLNVSISGSIILAEAAYAKHDRSNELPPTP